MSALAQCYENGTGVEMDIKLAILWYERAASSGDSKAAEKLITLIANPTLIDGLFSHGYVAPAA